jgi:hypothetical protein
MAPQSIENCVVKLARPINVIFEDNLDADLLFVGNDIGG